MQPGPGLKTPDLGNRFLYNGALAYRVFGEMASESHSHDPRAAYAHAGHDRSRMVTKSPVVAAPHGHVALDALLEINGGWHDKQRTFGIADPNSGGNAIFISPGLRLTVEKWSSYVMVGIPVVGDYASPSPSSKPMHRPYFMARRCRLGPDPLPKR